MSVSLAREVHCCHQISHPQEQPMADAPRSMKILAARQAIQMRIHQVLIYSPLGCLLTSLVFSELALTSDATAASLRLAFAASVPSRGSMVTMAVLELPRAWMTKVSPEQQA
jgi:hypothetical protein